MRYSVLFGFLFVGLLPVDAKQPSETLEHAGDSEPRILVGESANKELVRRYIELVWNEKDYTRHAEFLSQNCTLNGDPLGGVEGANEWVRYWHTIFPDQRKTFLRLLAENDQVVAHFLEEGTHSAELFGVPATGAYFKYPVVAFFRIDNGKIVEITALADHLELYKALTDRQ